MIRFTTSGNTSNTDSFLDKMIHGDPFSKLDEYAQKGVRALQSATPEETGLTASSWTYEIERTSSGATIWWNNSNIVNGFNVAIGLQYGHGTGTGGWIEGYDYINPALRPIFDDIANGVWEEVQQS